MNTRDGQERHGPTRRGLVLHGAALLTLGCAPVLAGAGPAAAAAPGARGLSEMPRRATGAVRGRASRRWSRPLPGYPRVTAAYGIPGNWLAGHHTGIDFATRVGTPVYSIGNGDVVLARRSGDYGKVVKVRMDDGHYVLFAHLSRIAVRRGEQVRAGDRIGSSGATGRVTGPHLHFEVRARRGYGSDVNPVTYLARRGVRLV